jgi:Uma2 family endonuclease
MAAAIIPPEISTEALPRKRFTREEIEELIEAGFFAGQRYELIDGDLINKMGQRPPHAAGIMLIQEWLATFIEVGRIRVQLSMEAARGDRKWTIPEPDVAVVAERKPDYAHRHPRGDEMLLAVEVADSTVRFDLTRKAVLYARAGVPEYWVLIIPRRQLVVHREPRNGEYQRIQIHAEDQIVSMEGRWETVTVSDLLPAPESSAPPASAPGNPPPPAS